MRPESRSPIFLLLCLSAIAAGSAVAQTPRRVGSEFQVNTYTPHRQHYPAIATDPAGGFVVVWQSYSQDGSAYGVFAQRFDSSGAPLDGELQVNTHFTGFQGAPDVAMLSQGDFVVVWESALVDGPEFGVVGQRFDSSGTSLATEFLINTFTVSFQLTPRVAADADGDFVVVWATLAPTPDIRAQRFASTGARQGLELQINLYTNASHKHPALAMETDGDFVIAWTSQNQDGEGYGVFARRFDSAGNGVGGGEFQVNTYTPLFQSNPAVALDPDGDFVIAWRSLAQDGSDSGVFARRFSASGTALAAEFQVNTHTVGQQRYPAATMETNGGFVVAWESANQDALSGYGIFARRFDALGNALGVEFQVNASTENGERTVAIDTDAAGDFVFAWSAEHTSLTDSEVLAHRFSQLGALDVDGDGEVQALTDGLLFLRFAFQFTGSTLTTGAVDLDCTRCDSASIVSYLTGLGLELDIDGSGEVEALTDGLLVLRFEFGFTGATLTSNAIELDCVRCEAAAILPYLQAL
jgi:hypothetical protein